MQEFTNQKTGRTTLLYTSRLCLEQIHWARLYLENENIALETARGFKQCLVRILLPKKWPLARHGIYRAEIKGKAFIYKHKQVSNSRLIHILNDIRVRVVRSFTLGSYVNRDVICRNQCDKRQQINLMLPHKWQFLLYVGEHPEQLHGDLCNSSCILARHRQLVITQLRTWKMYLM